MCNTSDIMESPLTKAYMEVSRENIRLKNENNMLHGLVAALRKGNDPAIDTISISEVD